MAKFPSRNLNVFENYWGLFITNSLKTYTLHEIILDRIAFDVFLFLEEVELCLSKYFP